MEEQTEFIYGMLSKGITEYLTLLVPANYRLDIWAQAIHQERHFHLYLISNKPLRHYSKEFQKEIISQAQYLNTIPNHPEKEKIVQRALVSLHDDIVSEFKTWIDSYYLGILQEKFLHKNSKINVNLPKVKINTKNTTTDVEGLPVHQKNWLTQANFTSFAWNSFRGYPVGEKLNLFFSSVNYKPDEDTIKCIRYHIEIRNCIHHDGGIVTKKILDRLGVLNISLESGEVYAKGEKIKLTVTSIIYFIDSLSKFINSYRDHMRKFFFYA